METAALVLLVVFLGWIAYSWKKPAPVIPTSFNDVYTGILETEVNFYKKLAEPERKVFRERMLNFLSKVKITGVGCQVADEDRVFVAASAIIPIFGFPGWEYQNINEVLLYRDSFNQDFDSHETAEKTVLGMVGNGAMQHMMVLSQQSLREGFTNETDNRNTGIHEFVHLLDKTDGEVDGMPESLLPQKHLVPWLKHMSDGIRKIMENRSDINPYGATNEAEFLAVAAEYFFERPDLLQARHPELYELLQLMFRQPPAIEADKN